MAGVVPALIPLDVWLAATVEVAGGFHAVGLTCKNVSMPSNILRDTVKTLNGCRIGVMKLNLVPVAVVGVHDTLDLF